MSAHDPLTARPSLLRHGDRLYVEVAVKVFLDEPIHPDLIRDDIAEVLHKAGYEFSADWIACSADYPIKGARFNQDA